MRKISSENIYKIVVAVAGLLGLAKGLSKHKNLRPVSAPTDLSLASWKRALLETKSAIADKNLGALASGVAYGGTLAFFPLVVASVAIASLLLSRSKIQEVVAGLGDFLPKDMAALLTEQLTNALEHNSANALIAVAGIALALFSVSGAMNSLVHALNIAYGTQETRGFIRVRLLSIALTIFVVLGMIFVLPLVALGGSLLAHFGVPAWVIGTFSVLRWVILAAIMTFGLAILYRYAPDKPREKWQWVSWGAAMATVLWLIVTALFFVYVQYFSNFSQSYSLFAGIIVLMMWLNFTGLVVLVGAEVNHRLEQQTPIRSRKLDK